MAVGLEVDQPQALHLQVDLAVVLGTRVRVELQLEAVQM
jgi:hypothetical protein